MRTELAKIWHLRQKQISMESSAATISSPGFEPHYGGSGKKCAPFEADIIAACDMQDAVDEAVRVYIQSIEADNREILSKTTGQRQRVLRLWTIAEKSIGDIATILGICEKTVERRLSDMVSEKTYASEFQQAVFETKLMRVDAMIEECIARMYREVEKYVDCFYLEVDELISRHKANAKNIMAKHDRQANAIKDAISRLDKRDHYIVMAHLAGGKEWIDVAEELGLSESHVRRLYVNIISKMSVVSA